eukprot:1192690-Prorocentrum_minimum.AAC.1
MLFLFNRLNSRSFAFRCAGEVSNASTVQLVWRPTPISKARSGRAAPNEYTCGHSRAYLCAPRLRTSRSPSKGIYPAAGPVAAAQKEYTPPPEQSQRLNRNSPSRRTAPQLRGYYVDVKGYSVDVKGYSVDVKGQVG